MDLLAQEGMNVTHQAQVINTVKSAVKTLLSQGVDPISGAQWRSDNHQVEVYFRPASRYSAKPSYRLVDPRIGVWVGYFTGKHSRGIGSPSEVMSSSELARERFLNTRSSAEIIAEGLNS
jgi:hypothetical protein